jgi:hypothetical protein
LMSKSKEGIKPKLQRWILNLASFDFTVEHRNGNKHTNADSMTRPPFANPESNFWIDECCEHKYRQLALVMMRSQAKSRRINEIKEFEVLQKKKDPDSSQDEDENMPDVNKEAEYPTSNHRYPCIKESCKRSSSSSSTGVFTPLDISPSKSVDQEPNFEDSFGLKAELFDSKGYMEEEQNNDAFCRRIKNYIEKGIVDNLEFKRFMKNHAKNFEIVDNLIVRKPEEDQDQDQMRTVVPAKLQNNIMFLHHGNILGGHFGKLKTFERIKSRLWWCHTRQDIKECVQTCQDCQRKKGRRELKLGRMNPITATQPWEIISFDVVGPLKTTILGNQYILVMEDHFTKWPEAFALPNQEAKTIAKVIVEQIICRYGAPKSMLTDRGTNFQSELVTNILSIPGIKRKSTTAYHPQCDRLTERFNRTLLERLAFYVNHHHDDWDQHLPYALFAYRSAQHASTGFTPYFLLFNQEPHLPSNIAIRPTEKQKSQDQIFERIDQSFGQAQHNIIQAQKQQKRNYNNRRKEHNYFKGEYIWIFNPVIKSHESKKFVFHWTGPYQIIEIYNNNTLKAQAKEGPIKKQRVHCSQTKRCYNKDSHPPTREYDYEYLRTPEDFEIDAILDKTMIEDQEHYLVHFRGYSKRYNQWIAKSNLNAKELIDKYKRQQYLVEQS